MGNKKKPTRGQGGEELENIMTGAGKEGNTTEEGIKGKDGNKPQC